MSDWRENERLREKVARLEQELEEMRSGYEGRLADAAEEQKETSSRLSALEAALRHSARELQYILDSPECEGKELHQTSEGKACVALAESLLGPMHKWPEESNASRLANPGYSSPAAGETGEARR